MVRRIIERRGVDVNQNNPGPEDSGLVQLFFNPKSKISASQMPANLVLDSLISVMIEIKKVENAVTLSDRPKIRCCMGSHFWTRS